MRTLLVALAAVPGDAGYERMFEDSLTEVDWQCWSPTDLGGKVPAWLKGSFILPTVGQFSFAGKAFQGVLDGFGKLHRFQFDNGQVCVRAKMMRTNFYNRSHELGTVAPNVLFMETEPPRTNCHLPLCNAKGANDNTYVNTIKMGEQYTTWTDSPTLSRVNPIRVEVDGVWGWDDKVATRPLHVPALGSAHPVRRNGTGDWVALVTEAPMVDGLQKAFTTVVTISDANPHERDVLWTSPPLDETPYFHSYGVTEDFVVLPFTPMAFDMSPMLENKPMMQCFHQASTGEKTPKGDLETTFFVIPFNGSEAMHFKSKRAFTYGHIINSFQNETGIVFDACAYQDANLFLTAGAGQLKYQRSRELRNSLKSGSQRAWRYVLHTSGPLAGQVTDEPLGLPGRSNEFPKINMAFSTKPHCTYYVTEGFHNDVDFASVAIGKHNVCTGKRQWWYRPSTYPSEPFFVPQPGGGEEDGVLLFGATDGLTNTSSLVVVDASTMDTVAEVLLPFVITFTTHGEWFDGMVGDPSSAEAAASIFI